MNPMCQMSFSARIVRTFVLNTRHKFIKGSDSGNWTLTDEFNCEITRTVLIIRQQRQPVVERGD